MISALIIFLCSCAASFIGSLQLGPVNLFVINSILHQNKKTAYQIAIGGCIPEFIYCALAVFTNNYLLEYEWLIFLLKIFLIIILLALSILFFLKKQNKVNSQNIISEIKKPNHYILTGFTLASLNPQLLPFWMFVQVFFNSIDFLEIQTHLHKFSYILGAGVGAFILLVLLMQITTKYKQTFLKYLNNKYYYKALSLLFLFIAIQQTWMLLNKK